MSPFPTHVLIPTHRRETLLRRLLGSLEPPTEASGAVTYWIIENGSAVAEGIVAEYDTDLPLRYVHFAVGNKSKALNAVIETLPPESLLVFFDDDVALHAGTVEALVAAAGQFPSGRYFGGAVLADYEVPPPADLLAYLPLSGRDYDLSAGAPIRTFDDFRLLLGANWACWRRDLLATGGFSADYGPGAASGARGQEHQAQSKLFAAGLRPVFVRAAAVDHWVPKKILTLDWVTERINRGSVRKGKEEPSVAHTLVMLAKLAFSLLSLPFFGGKTGNAYRIAKAAGYFTGYYQRLTERS